MIHNPLRTPLKLHAPAFLACAAFSLLPLLSPCLPASACRLPPAPLFFVCSGLPVAVFVVLVGVCGSPSLVVLFRFVCVACLLFGLVCLCSCVLFVSGCFLWFASCLCWLRLTSYWTDTYVSSAFTCTTKALIYHCTCVSVRRLDRFTCTVSFIVIV